MTSEWFESNLGITASNASVTTTTSVSSCWPNWYPDSPDVYAQPNYSYVYYTYPPFDYDLLAEKIVEKLKGKESRSIEDVRKELNKLLDEIDKKEKKA